MVKKTEFQDSDQHTGTLSLATLCSSCKMTWQLPSKHSYELVIYVLIRKIRTLTLYGSVSQILMSRKNKDVCFVWSFVHTNQELIIKLAPTERNRRTEWLQILRTCVMPELRYFVLQMIWELLSPSCPSELFTCRMASEKLHLLFHTAANISSFSSSHQFLFLLFFIE